MESLEREGGYPQTTWVSLLINHPLPCCENLNEEVQLAANATTKELIVHRQKIVFRYTYDNTIEFIIRYRKSSNMVTLLVTAAWPV